MKKPTAHLVPIDARRRAQARGSAAGSAVAGAPRELLGQTYVRQYGVMKEFLRRRTGSAEVAEELIQEAWVAISPRADDRTIENPEAWLQRVVVNLALNWVKAAQFRSRFLHPEAGELPERADEAPGADRTMHYRQSLDYVKQLIDELPPRRRDAFLLCRGEGLSLEEAAARMRVSVKTVSAQVIAAAGFLRGRLIEAGLWP